MALFVIPVDQPAAGAEWSYTVPGEYIEHITAVSATLDTPGGTPFVAADASGNGNDGQYVNTAVPPATPGFVPGLVPGDLALHTGDAAGNDLVRVFVGFDVADASTDFTVLWWQSASAAYAGKDVIGWDIEGTTFGFSIQAHHVYGPAGNFYLTGLVGTQWATAAGTMPADGLAHFFAFTFNQGSQVAVLYVDGVVVPWATTATGLTNNPADEFDINFHFSPEVQDEVATFRAVLSAGQVANLYAQRASFAAYSPAVLALGPTGYWHLDDVVYGGPGRQVDLIVTDGTRTVLEVPTGFAAPSGTSPFAYSWQPNLNSSTETPTGTATTVAVPDLILPAGYTIGTRTLDLAAGDQWSAINIWWDDSVMQANPDLNPIDYPPGAYLVIVPQGA